VPSKLFEAMQTEVTEAFEARRETKAVSLSAEAVKELQLPRL
jgi:hypothetical protein